MTTPSSCQRKVKKTKLHIRIAYEKQQPFGTFRTLSKQSMVKYAREQKKKDLAVTIEVHPSSFFLLAGEQ